MNTNLSFIIPRAPLVDNRGFVSRDGVQFFLGLFNRTGGDDGVDVAELAEVVRVLALELDVAEAEIDVLQAQVAGIASQVNAGQHGLAAVLVLLGTLKAQQANTYRQFKGLEAVCLSNLVR
jgi:hypothetical protein